ncbi:MAG: CFI-box-CTERM domain-containing protein [Bacteriovoracaceae bacterium]
MKTWISLFLLLFASDALATFKVEFSEENVEDMEVQMANATQLTFYDVNLEDEGDESSISSAMQFHVPIDTTDGSGPYHIYGDGNIPENTGATTYTGWIKIKLDITNSLGDTADLHLMVSDDDDISGTDAEWQYVQIYADTSSNNYTTTFSNGTTDSEQTIYLNLGDVCGTDASGDLADCETLIGSDETKVRYLYFFIDDDDTDHTIGDNSQTPDDHDGNGDGLYIRLNLSDDFDDIGADVANLDSITRGDTLLTLNYSGSSTDVNSVRVCQEQASTCTLQAGQPIGTAIGGASACNLNSELFPAVEDSSISVTGLTNGLQYCMAVVYVNEFGFASRTSNVESQTPFEIEQLLEQTACFIATAGFKDENFVVANFRAIRDQILLKTPLGKAFVALYYKYSPPIAKWMLLNSWSRPLVRVFLYAAYIVVNFWKLILLQVLGVILLGFALKALFRRQQVR